MRNQPTSNLSLVLAGRTNISCYIIDEKTVVGDYLVFIAEPTVETQPPVFLVTKQMEMYEVVDSHELLTICFEQLLNRIEVYELTGSGWILSNLVELDTTVWQLNPLSAST